MSQSIREDNFTELKSSFSDAVIETLVAFANAKGGRVIIGVNDKGTPVNGFSIGSESIPKWVNEIKTKTQPSIIPDVELVKLEGQDVVSLKIQEFPVKPVAFKGRYFKRVNNSNHQLSVLEITDLNLQSLQISWDSCVAHSKTLADLDFKKIEVFFDKVKNAGRFVLEGSVLESLEKLCLIKGQLITNAAWLLFGKEGTGYNVHLGRFKTPSHIIDDKMHNGTLFDMVETIMRYLISQIKVAFEIKGMPTQRTEIFEYPLPALREIAINCLIHRNYLSPIDVQICLFDNYVEFYNPGGLAGSLTVEDLKRDDYKAHARNKLIAEAFYLTGDIEKYGSGFLRIRREISTYPTMKLEFREAPNGFLNKLSYRDQKIVTKQVDEGLNGAVSEGVNEGVNKLLNLIAAEPGIRTPNLESKLKVPVKTIERWLRTLRNEYKLEFRGSAKTGGYFILTSFREAIDGVSEGVSEGVNEGVNKLLKLIAAHPGTRLPNLEAALNVPRKSIERWLKILREQNKIEFRGAAKTGGYFVIESNLVE